MTTIAPSSSTTAAERLVASLPVVRPLSVRPIDRAPAEVTSASVVAATLVGSPSASLVLALLDPSALRLAGGDTVSAADLLLPSLEAAGSALGTGVVSLGTDQSALTDPESAFFELLDGAVPAGWFAVRIERVQSLPLDADVLHRIGRINDVEMQLSVVLGRTRRQVREVLSLEPGSIVELDRAAGEPADLLVNGHLVALGEVVVVDQHYAVRVTRILDNGSDLN